MLKTVELQFSKAKQIWNSLYNDKTSPYLNYFFQSLYRKYLWFGMHRFGMRYRLFCIYKDNSPVCLASLIMSWKKMYIAGDLCASGILDFVYRDNEIDEAMCRLFIQN